MILRVVLAFLLWAAGMNSNGRTETSPPPLSPQAFTQEFARALTSAMPKSTVLVRGELELLVKDPNGAERTLFLTNMYQDYTRDPARFGDIVKTFVAAMLKPGKAPAKLDPARIVPVIKDRQWLVELNRTLKAQGHAQEHLADDFNNELVIVYAEDDPTRMRYLTSDEDIGIARAELRKRAVDNLRRILPKIEMQGDDHVLMVSAGGDYEASLLLIDEIWSGGQLKVNGDIVVAIPARDVLLVTGSHDRSGLKRMREAAAKLVAQGPYGLTDALFVYRNGRFTKFGRQ
jgi:uncharacterized protein YtpQ (UPF0354 family)